MTIEALTNSDAICVLFDGCPTCNPRDSKYLDNCRTRAQQTHRRLYAIPSGSQIATLIRTIAKNQGQPIKYPMILINGTIKYEPQDITTNNERIIQ
jgi:hypothetical protein